MNLIPDASFRAWAAEVGLLADPRYPGSEQLVFAGSLDAREVWLPPAAPSELPNFLTAAIRLASPAGPYRLRLRGGGPFYGDPDSPREQIMARILRSLGVPSGANGALEFSDQEWDSLLMLASTFYVFGYRVQTDLEVVTPERTASLLFSHHGELDIHFASLVMLGEFAAGMRRNGYVPAGEEADTR
jgi:hypothetical protein